MSARGTSRRSSRAPACRLIALAALVACGQAAADPSIVGTRHNLSATGPGPIKSVEETQVCVFCHVGHNGRARMDNRVGPSDVALGTNRPPSTATYQPYNSETMTTAPGMPSGATRVCLSCHDGTVALGETVASGRIRVENAPGGLMPPGATNVGTDLRQHHPVSFRPGPSTVHRAPSAGDQVKLDRGGEVQCTSCHDPHRDNLDPLVRKFLVKPNNASAICLSCHSIPFWLANPSSHQSSTAVFDTSKGAPTPYTTVADTGCASCHVAHGGAPGSKLLRGAQAKACMPCHEGLVARYDIRSEQAKTYSHPVLSGDNEVGPRAGSRFCRCIDCHNPHAARQLPAVAPMANGFLSGVSGVDRYGAAVSYARFEYEVCFKCHGDSPNQPQAVGPTPPESLRRETIDVNLRRVFDPNAPSAHPVVGPSRGSDVPSLIAPLAAGSMIYCGDCHSSDAAPAAGGAGPRGPHGSSYRHILERNYSTEDFSVESPQTYALCYKCHDRAVLMDPSRTAFRSHAKHVQQLGTPCSACHDSHGVSTMQGNQVNNAHLINFDVSIVQPTSTGIRSYVSQGRRMGTCSVRCHNTEHLNRPY